MSSVNMGLLPEYPTLKSNFLSDTPISLQVLTSTKKYTSLTKNTNACFTPDIPFKLDFIPFFNL